MCRILFISSNGAGLGHLTRLMAIARRLPAKIQPIFLTLSQALPVVRQQGYFVEYLYSAGWAELSRRQWNGLLAHRLSELLETYQPAAVIFDGTYPYLGLLDIARQHPEVPFVWSRRGMWRAGLGVPNLQAVRSFARVFEPGEFAADLDRGATAGRNDAKRLGPVVFSEHSDLMDRETAQQKLGLQGDRVNVLIQLGAGNINDIHSEAGLCLGHLRTDRRVQVVVAESIIADRPLELPADVQRVRTYPLTRYYRAFDFAVSASGYNSFHELVGFGVPTLFSPNLHTALDDQSARARYAELEGIGMWLKDKTSAGAATALGPLLNDDNRQEIRHRLGLLAWTNGAATAAELLSNLANQRNSQPCSSS